MSDESEDRQIILRPARELSVGETKNSVLNRMTEGVVAVTRSHQLSQRSLKRIGNFEFDPIDYQAVMMWSMELSISPESILEVLSETTKDDFSLRVECGRFVSLVWDFDQLPIKSVTWCDSLVLEQLQCVGECSIADRVLKPKIHSLRVLRTQEIRLKTIDLLGVPNLNEIYCDGNQLAELDLSSVPLLTNLGCSFNELTALDLSPVPLLTNLGCSFNQLTDLDLSPVPLLTNLRCSFNQLTDLDLSPVPLLTNLECTSNQLTDLDLSPVPLLTNLDCWENRLTDLDLSPVTLLTILDCSRNRLTDPDLSPVPLLTSLDCSYNQLTDLDLSPVPLLTSLTCTWNQITELDLSTVPLLTRLEKDAETQVFDCEEDKDENKED